MSFDMYESEYQGLATKISKQISRIPSQNGEQKKSSINSADRNIEEAEQLLAQMNLEVHSAPPAVKATLQQKLRVYKEDIAKLKEDLRRSATAFAAGGREELFSGVSEDMSVTSMDQRTRLLATTEKLNQSSSYIQQSQQIALETEEIGANILTDLHSQRETIVHARDRLHVADDNLSKARRVISGMARRMMSDKIIMGFIILVLLIAIFLVLWFKVISPLLPSGDDDGDKKS